MLWQKIWVVLLISLLGITITGCISPSEKTLEELETDQQENVVNDVTKEENEDLPFMIDSVVTSKGEGNVLFGSLGEGPMQIAIKNNGQNPVEFAIKSMDGNQMIDQGSLASDETYSESKIELPKGKYVVYFQQNSGAEIIVSVKTDVVK